MNAGIAEPPPLTVPPARPAAAKRVAIGLVVFGIFDLVTTVVSLVAVARAAAHAGGGVHPNLNGLFSCLLYAVAAWMVWKDKRVIWPILAFLSAGGLGLVIGVVAALLGRLPADLLRALAAAGMGETSTWVAWAGVYLLFLGWILWESQRVDWGNAFRRPLRWWLRPSTCTAIMAILGAGFVVSLLGLLQSSWTAEAIARAREIHGGDRSYLVLNYHVHSTNQLSTHTAEVLAYGPDGVERIPLRWQVER